MSDTLAALSNALAPKNKRRLRFPTDFYALGSMPASSKRIVNAYAEALPNDARSDVIVRNTPGLVPSSTIGDGPIVTMNDTLSGRLYIVSGTHFWRLRPPAEMSPEDLGVVGSPVDGFVSIAVGTIQTVVCVPPNAFICTHSGALFQITGAFPGASSVAYIDGYFVFTAYANSSQWFYSGLLDGTAYSAFDFAYADTRPNVVRRVVFHRGDLWFMGESGLEAWYDAGGVDLPFARRVGSDIAYGCGAPQSVAICDNSLFFLGFAGVVFRINGYQAVRVSNHAIEEWIRNQNDYVNVDACAYTQGGHWFYCLSFTGSHARTFVYDTVIQRWHERASGSGGTGAWRGRSIANRGSVLVVGDRTTNKLFELDPYTYSDNGQLLTGIITMPPLWADTHREFMSSLELEMQPGLMPTDNRVTLEISDNGGFTYRQRPDGVNVGSPGTTKHRVRWTRLGSYRQRVLQFSLNGPFALYGADADFAEGVT